MDPQTNMYFANLMQSTSDEELFIMEPQCFDPSAQVTTQETPFTSPIGTMSKKQQRGGNFTKEEDKLLASAWLNISMDAIKSNEKKRATFWQRVKDFIEENDKSNFNRTVISLKNRWSTIQLCTSKFCSSYEKIEALNQSGTNEEDKVRKAKTLYKEINGYEFKFDHCWFLLRNQPKWFLECEKKNEGKKPRNELPFSPTPDTINLGDDDVLGDDVVDVERPVGQKAKKARLKKQKNEEKVMSQCFDPSAPLTTQETPVTPPIGTMSKKQQRGGNFTIEEDELLVSAWLNTSMDAIKGNDQKKATFWQRVKDFIEENDKSNYNRTMISLKNRWSTIQLCTSKFCSCYGKIDALNQSGTNEEDKVRKAKALYKEINGYEFKFDHCWFLLRNQPKWFLACEKKNEGKKPRNELPFSPTPDMINLGDDDVPGDDVVDVERPAGQKAKKAWWKKQKNEEKIMSQCFDSSAPLTTQDPSAPLTTQETPVTSPIGTMSKKQQRGGNFTIEEDELLVSAWLNISMDAIKGNDQEKASFWQRVKDFIEENDKSKFNRTVISLKNRWSTIQLCTSKFCSSYGKIEALNQSGTNELDKVRKAKTLYKEINGYEFKFDHCWFLLRNQPKWLECEKKNEGKKPRNELPFSPTPDTINLGDDDVPGDDVVDVERPAGQKAEKVRLKKQKNEEIVSTEICLALDKISECKSKLTDKKLEMYEKLYYQEEEKLRIKREMLEMKQFKEDERVMTMDLNCLPEEQQEFYKLKRLEILGKRRRVQ